MCVLFVAQDAVDSRLEALKRFDEDTDVAVETVLNLGVVPSEVHHRKSRDVGMYQAAVRACEVTPALASGAPTPHAVSVSARVLSRLHFLSASTLVLRRL